MAELNWEKKEKVGMHDLLDQINDLTRQVVAKELVDISSKIEILHQMGLLQDSEELTKMKDQLKAMKIEPVPSTEDIGVKE